MQSAPGSSTALPAAAMPVVLRQAANDEPLPAIPRAGAASMDDAADRACVLEVLNGQHASFNAIVQRHQARVHRFLLRHTQHADDALDLAQETFIQAYLKLPAWRGEARFSTWLLGVALNLARNHANRSPRLRHAHVELDDEARAGELVDTHDPCQALAQSARHAAMQRAIDALPTELREPLVLIAIEGRAYEETATLLGIPGGTLKSRLNRARRVLRASLADHLDDGGR